MAAHRDAMEIGIIHRDISGGNILLCKNEKGRWRGLLADWELSKDTSLVSTQRQVGRTVRCPFLLSFYHILISLSQGTLQFSAARVLDNPEKLITAADEIECVFHALIYYAVRFLHHNLPDKSVGVFLNNYFDASSGVTSTGQLTVPVVKREAMKTGVIALETYGVFERMRFAWVDDEPQAEGQGADAGPDGATPPPDYNHPLNELLDTLLSWFRALYTVDFLDREKSATNASSGSGPPPRRGRGKPAIDISDLEADPHPHLARATAPSLRPSYEQEEELRILAKKLDGHAHVVALFRDCCVQSFPSYKGKDKRPEKGYAPCSPDTPQFSELSGFTDFGVESEDEAEDRGLAVPDAPAPSAFVELAAADGGRNAHRATSVVPGACEDEPDDDDRSRSPSPCPARPKRAATRPKRDREDDRDVGRETEDGAAPGTFGKRSRY